MYTSTFTCVATTLLSIFTITTALPITPHDLSQPSPSTPRPVPRAAGQPVITRDFADPSFIQLADGYYAFATTASPDTAIQVARSASFNNPNWEVLNVEVLPDPGAWTDHSTNVWAPYVHQIPSGSFVMYYAAPPASDPSKHCIGVATAKTITGPFIPSPAPWTCPLSAGGAIDPSFFTDPKTGNTYILYKIDGNSLNVPNGPFNPTPIMLQQVNRDDGITPIGPAISILNRGATDGPLVEAPVMIFANGVYFLLVSTNMYNTNAYDIRYVSANSPTGPFSQQQVLLHTGDGNGIAAPGSGDIHDGHMVFHGTVAAGPIRNMYAGSVKVEGTKLSFQGFV